MNCLLLRAMVIVAVPAIFIACQPGGAQQGSEPMLTPGAPRPESLTTLLGVAVVAAPGETNQYLIRAPQGSVDLTRVGRIHEDLGYAVGVTMSNGTQIGFRYEPLPPAEDKARN